MKLQEGYEKSQKTGTAMREEDKKKLPRYIRLVLYSFYVLALLAWALWYHLDTFQVWWGRMSGLTDKAPPTYFVILVGVTIAIASVALWQKWKGTKHD